ncbi:MAG: MptD family putative ECF transporter S component [Paludibacteraceae bacterium]|nr:MptD family putative ECF transporter S component [Paludibacteraceae bacterium]
MKSAIKIIFLAIAYLALFIIGASSGLIHPMCYAYIGAVLPLISALIYLQASTIIRSFGVAAILNGFILIMGLATGEADTFFTIGIVLLTAFAEIIRYCCKYDTLKGVRWSFIPFAYSFFAYTAHWWTDTEGSLAAAVEEMPTGYDQLMKPVIENTPMMIFVLLLTIPVSIFAMRLAERILKNRAAELR